jgi:hypothetical protein
MAAQLVLSELHRVQRLVNALAERLESVRVRTAGFSGVSGVRSGEGAEAGAEAGAGVRAGADGELGVDKGARTPPLSVPTFCQLEGDLRKRLRVLSSETIDLLRRA